MLDTIAIVGLRGFAESQKLVAAKPNGAPASGLTVIVGANNAGKSTVIEALRAVIQNSAPSFTQGRRNRAAGDKIEIVVTTAEGIAVRLASVEPGTSECERTGPALRGIHIVPSRRAFAPFFGRSEAERDSFMQQMSFPATRTSSIDAFSNRLFTAQKNRAAFDAVLEKVVSPVPKWSIDQQDGGNYFLRLSRGDVVHSSEGLGEGLISLLFIADALYDSKPGDTIVIDEPELSLHPALARKLATLFGEYAKDRQIILATHSPYFVDLAGLERGATVARVHIREEHSHISQLTPAGAGGIRGLLANENNPHILGLNAQEIFFLDDGVILVEGQEDVLFFRQVERSIGLHLLGTYFGWGVGGADNMRQIAAILNDLGFLKVVGILDANKAALAKSLSSEFPHYVFDVIPADDVRSKKASPERAASAGLLDDKNASVRDEYKHATSTLFGKINAYLHPSP